jgi:hypothetical protein
MTFTAPASGKEMIIPITPNMIAPENITNMLTSGCKPTLLPTSLGKTIES